MGLAAAVVRQLERVHPEPPAFGGAASAQQPSTAALAFESSRRTSFFPAKS